MEGPSRLTTERPADTVLRMDSSTHARSADAEWKILRTEAASLYQQGEYERAYAAAEQAAAAAEASFGPED
jgi:hypothetical protein